MQYRYVVVCYAIHEKEIASHKSFENKEDAYAFVKKDAQNTFDEELDNSTEEGKNHINFENNGNGTAYLSSCDGEFKWTWEVIEL